MKKSLFIPIILLFLTLSVISAKAQEANANTHTQAVSNAATHSQELATQHHTQAHEIAVQSHESALKAHDNANEMAMNAHREAMLIATQANARAHTIGSLSIIESRVKAQYLFDKQRRKVSDRFYKEQRADNSNVRYTGRVLKVDDGSVSFDWSGSYLEIKFTGGFLAIRVSDTRKNYYNLFVNGRQEGVITTFGKDSVIVLAADAGRRENVIKLQKRSEGEQGMTTIHSLVLSSRGEVLPYNPGRDRHIEFIGNSITAGFGTEGKSKDEMFLASTENCNLAFGAILSRYFNTDYTFIAHSGWGAARNYGDSLPVSRISMKDKMLQTFDMDPGQMWNFTSYKPDIVVINLGSNDFSTRPHPNKDQFTSAYMQIISQLRAKYGDTPILCVAPARRGMAFEYIQEMVANSKDPNLHFTAYHYGIYNSDSDLGSVGHPNYEGQKKIAMALIPYISTITGWTLTGKPVK
jgi:lysophospholipase L1-like esterase